MATLTNGAMVKETNDLLPCVHVVKDGEIKGWIFFENCRASNTWHDWLTGGRTEYSICWALVSVKKDGIVVRPYGGPYGMSNDFRSDTIDLGDIVAPDGTKCVSAQSPFRRMNYESNKTYHVNDLDTQLNERCKEGLHFCPTLDSLKRYIDFTDHRGYYSVALYNKDGKCVNRTSHNTS